MPTTLICEQTKQIAAELTESLSPGNLLVIGCSTSEITGRHIGSASSADTAAAVVDVLMPLLSERGISLAAQCCEHLNRALVVERETAERYNLIEVSVRPRPHAGGAFAAAVYDRMKNPVVVEAVGAHAGIDIGCTLIGMHLRPVAVPFRSKTTHIGEALATCALTRPKYIGGPRAEY